MQIFGQKKRYILGIVAASFVMLASSGIARAQSNSGGTPNPPELIQSLVVQGAQIRYLGNDLGYEGWLGIRAGQVQYFYVDPKTNAIFTGVLFDQKGKPVTFEQIRRLQQKEGSALDLLTGASDQIQQIETLQSTASPQTQALDPSKNLSKSEQLIRAFEAANWIPLGLPKAPVVYMIIDPKCPHCHDQLKDFQAAVAGGKVQLRVIPVGVLGKDSLAQAAFLLAADQPGQLLMDSIAMDKELPVQGDINTQAVQKNMALLADYKLDSTPISVYRAKAGQVKIVVGRAKDSAKILTDLP